MALSLIVVSLALWVSMLLLPWRPWSTREHIECRVSPRHPEIPLVSVLIPARDEAESVARTLRAVDAQGAVSRIVLVDDQSSDGTVIAPAHSRFPTSKS